MRRRTALGALATLTLGRGVFAQAAYPDKPVRLVVAFAPGGFTDIVGRLTAAKLSEALGQQVFVDNKAGAGGIIGTEVGAKAAPDGYTLLLGTISTHAMNPHLYKSLSYDPVKDFAPVARVATSPNILVVHPSVPAQTVAELIAIAKAKPGSPDSATVGRSGTKATRSRGVTASARSLPACTCGSALGSVSNISEISPASSAVVPGDVLR